MPTTLAALAGQALACIEDPIIIEKILAHLKTKEDNKEAPATLPPTRAPAGAARHGSETDRLTANNITDDAAKGMQGSVRLHPGKAGEVRDQEGHFLGFGTGDDGLRHGFRQVPGNNFRLDCPRLAVYSSYVLCSQHHKKKRLTR